MVGLRKSQASVGASLAYWFGNTMLNPATLVFMGFVLGWQWTALRLVLGIVLVFGIAYLANRFVHPEDVPPEAQAALAAAQADQASGGDMFARWVKSLWQLFIGLIPEYLVLVFALGAARAWLFPEITPAIGHSIWLLIGLAVAGTLFVIPTAGEIPIVQTLMTYGLGAGPGGALLATLPPVSLPSLAMVAKSFPKRVLVFVAGSVCILGILTGLAAMMLGF